MKYISLIGDNLCNGHLTSKDNDPTVDNFHGFIWKLNQEFNSYGYTLVLPDNHNYSNSEFELYWEMPSKKPKGSKNRYLIALECKMLRKDNYDTSKYHLFNKIFTWNEDLINNKNVIKINYSIDLDDINSTFTTSKERFISIFCSNKKSYAINELYSERLRAIKWYEKNYPNNFDLYGRGWDYYSFNYPFSRFNKLNRLFPLNHPSYKGVVPKKKEVLSKYKFSICYENELSNNGYITEKVFDSFLCGTVPIYYGYNKIEDYIPSDCFIRFDSFPSYKELNNHLIGIDDESLYKLQMNIKRYLNSKQIEAFSWKYNAKKIVDSILSINQ